MATATAPKFSTDEAAGLAFIEEGADWFVAPVAPVRGIEGALELEAAYSGPFPSRQSAAHWATRTGAEVGR